MPPVLLPVVILCVLGAAFGRTRAAQGEGNGSTFGTKEGTPVSLIDRASRALAAEATGTKADCEMKYWLSRLKAEGYEKMVSLRHKEYHRWFTTKFGLDDSFYAGKRIADIGPGPRGSLEWADMAKLRVGIDPITQSYMELGIGRQKMSYVTASASAIPFADGYFDVVLSLNSLDHVSDLEGTIREIQRIIKPGGLFLFVTDVNHKATPCEPQQYGWDILEKFDQMEASMVKKYEKYAPGSTFYKKLMKEGKAPKVESSSQPYDFSNPTKRYGTLLAKLRKNG